MHPALATLLAVPVAAGVGLGLMHGALGLILSTLEDARVQVVVTDPTWAFRVDVAGAAALGLGALAAGAVVGLTGRVGAVGFTTRRLLAALASATAGMVTGLCGAAFHTARTAVPAAMGAEIGVVTPVVDATHLLLEGWAAGGVAGGLVLYAALSVLRGLLGAGGTS